MNNFSVSKVNTLMNNYSVSKVNTHPYQQEQQR